VANPRGLVPGRRGLYDGAVQLQLWAEVDDLFQTMCTGHVLHSLALRDAVVRRALGVMGFWNKNTGFIHWPA